MKYYVKMRSRDIIYAESSFKMSDLHGADHAPRNMYIRCVSARVSQIFALTFIIKKVYTNKYYDY